MKKSLLEIETEARKVERLELEAYFKQRAKEREQQIEEFAVSQAEDLDALFEEKRRLRLLRILCGSVAIGALLAYIASQVLSALGVL